MALKAFSSLMFSSSCAINSSNSVRLSSLNSSLASFVIIFLKCLRMKFSAASSNFVRAFAFANFLSRCHQNLDRHLDRILVFWDPDGPDDQGNR